MLEWLGLLVLVLVGAAVGYFLGQGSHSSSSSLPARQHHTISFDAKRQAEDAELDTEMAARDQADSGEATVAAESGSGGIEKDEPASEEDQEFRAYDEDDEDLQTTLAHMKQEHAAHLEQFNEATAAAAGSPVSDSSSTSPPAPFPQRRRIFIIAKSLPLHITNITGLPTPSATPMGSPLAGPMSEPSELAGASSSSSTADSMDGAFSLDGSGAAAAASASPAAPVNSFDQARRPSLAGFSGAGVDQLPCSRVVEHDGARFKVEWADSRSFLSNLRCLLTPPAASAAASPAPGAGAVSPTPTPASMPDGLAAAVPPAASTLPTDAPEVTWIGVSSVSDSRSFKTPEERAAYEATLRENHCVPVYMEKSLQDGYASFCKSILWPLLHYMMPTSSNENVGPLWQAYWDSYLAANQLFADRIVAEMQSPKDIVWIHNMHLFSLPKMIRSKVPRATIGLFIHTPFPSSDVFRSLPSRREILESMMESDLLGFHTFDYARHFLSCIKRVLDLDFETLSGGVLGVRYNGRFISILISHVGIQSHVFQEAASSELIRHRVEKLRKKHEGKKIIVGVDDVDVAKAPLLKLQAFDRFLSRHSEWVSKIVILEMFLPSKNMDTALGIKIQRDLDAYVVELKRKYGQGIIEIITPEPKGSRAAVEPPAAMVRGSSDQLQLPAPTALHKSNSGAVARSDPHEVSSGLKLLELVRLYNAADVAIISTFFDGLNLIPYECTASQSQGAATAPCALIISEFMGCSRSLNGVLRVNPWSLEMISDTLHQALNMSSDERRANHARRYNYVMNHTIERWARGFLDHLERATKLGAELNYVAVGSGASHKLLGLKHNFVHLPMQTLANTYSSASLRVILLDYDGTLVAADKSAGAGCAMDPPVGVLRLLKFLADQPNTVVFLMSGRTRAVLAEWFGDNPNLGLAAEKGLFLRWPANLARECRFDKNQMEESELERRERKLEQKQREDREREAARRNAQADDDESDSSVSSDDDEDDTESDSESSPSGPRASPPIPSPSPLVGPHDWECIVPLDDISWKAAALEIIRSYTEQTDGSWIEDKEFAIVWHYEQADVEYGRMQASDLQKYLVKVLANPAVDVLRYDKSRILEVKPHGVNKGLAATAILESLWIMHEKQTQAAQAAAVASISGGTPIASAIGTTAAPSTPQLPQPPNAFGSTPSPHAPGSATPGSATLSPRSQVTSFHPFVLAIGDDRSDEDIVPYVDTFPRTVALASSAVPTSIPPTPSHMMHDRENSPTPMSPSLSGGPHHRTIRGAPSADPLLFTVCVGVKPSSAQYYVNDVEGVLRSLYGLVLRDYEDRPPSAVSPSSSSSGDTSPRLGLTKRGAGASSGGRRGSTDSNSGGGMGPKRSSFASLLFGNKSAESKE